MRILVGSPNSVEQAEMFAWQNEMTKSDAELAYQVPASNCRRYSSLCGAIGKDYSLAVVYTVDAYSPPEAYGSLSEMTGSTHVGDKRSRESSEDRNVTSWSSKNVSALWFL